MSDQEPPPVPARDVLDKPHLDAEELQREIGDSEAWDEASEDNPEDNPNEAPEA